MHKMELVTTSAIMVRNVNGAAINLDVTKLSAEVAGKIFEVGAKTILTNTWNGKGAAATDKERLAALESKLAAWYRGEFNANGGERGDSFTTAQKNAFVNAQVAKGRSAAQAEAAIKAKVVAVFGKDTKATFGKYLDAIATELAKANKSTFEAERAKLEEQATKAANAYLEAESKAKLDEITADDLF